MLLGRTTCGRESELYALWQRYALPGTRLCDRDGNDIIVISSGQRNESAGPDFSGAVLIVGGRLMTGAIEMHRDERDWFLHNHHRDPAYSSVILHVVGRERSPRALPGISTVIASTIAHASTDGAVRSDARLDDAAARRMLPMDSGDGVIGISRSLLVECAWSRFLRRSLEITRTIGDGSIGDVLRREFLRRLFDALGYAANRKPMRATIALVLDQPQLDDTLDFDDAAALIFSAGCADPAIAREAGTSFLSRARLDRILGDVATDGTLIAWNRSTRPANAPERRLWAGARLLVDVLRFGHLERILESVAGPAPWSTLVDASVVRFGSESFVGRARAAEIVMNAVLPVALAAGIRGESPRLIHGACRLYRTAPAQQSNATVRRVEARYLDGRVLTAGFWQQGAIELHQRYLTPDRSALTFIAEPRAHVVIRRAYCVS